LAEQFRQIAVLVSYYWALVGHRSFATDKEIEIDIVAGNGKEYLFGECKWHKEKVGLEVLSSLQEQG
jgi:Holliday junction resolvase